MTVDRYTNTEADAAEFEALHAERLRPAHRFVPAPAPHRECEDEPVPFTGWTMATIPFDPSEPF